ncbi:membrane protein [Gordonia phage Baddon]|nr:membrane protein [Gordonia phage Baddon]
MNWRAAIVAAALVVACLAFVMLLGAGLLSRDDPEQGGRGIIVFGLLLIVSVAVAAGRAQIAPWPITTWVIIDPSGHVAAHRTARKGQTA